MADERYEARSIINDEDDDDDDSIAVFYNSREFAICESCMWTATIFKTRHGHRLLDVCPMCSSAEWLAFNPLTKEEIRGFMVDEERIQGHQPLPERDHKAGSPDCVSTDKGLGVFHREAV